MSDGTSPDDGSSSGELTVDGVIKSVEIEGVVMEGMDGMMELGEEGLLGEGISIERVAMLDIVGESDGRGVNLGVGVDWGVGVDSSIGEESSSVAVDIGIGVVSCELSGSGVASGLGVKSIGGRVSGRLVDSEERLKDRARLGDSGDISGLGGSSG